MEKKYIYSPEEIAKLLDISIRTVYSWIYKGKLKYFKAGRLTRVKKEDLEEFLGTSLPD